MMRVIDPTYDDYERALAALIQIPAQLNAGLALADEASASAKRAADGDLKQSQIRLASLRHTADSRYSSAVESLKAYNVLLPPQVRPEPAKSCDEDAIREAVGAHTRAASAVDSAIKASARSAAQEKADAASRAQAGQQAALALKLRRDRIRQEQADAVAREAKAQAELTAQRRKHALILSSTVAAIVVAATILVVVLLVSGN
ncbi:MAG: hypothetical protein QM705_02510 [Ancrocorticia sp.]